MLCLDPPLDLPEFRRIGRFIKNKTPIGARLQSACSETGLGRKRLPRRCSGAWTTRTRWFTAHLFAHWAHSICLATTPLPRCRAAKSRRVGLSAAASAPEPGCGVERVGADQGSANPIGRSSLWGAERCGVALGRTLSKLKQPYCNLSANTGSCANSSVWSDPNPSAPCEGRSEAYCKAQGYKFIPA